MLHANVLAYGLLDASFAAGAVAGSLMVGWFRVVPLRRATTYTFGAQGALFLAFSLARSPMLAGGALLGAGVANGIGNALIFTLLQRLVPDSLRGRVFGLLFTLFGLANPMGALAAGALLHMLPLAWAWWLAAATSLVLVTGIHRWLPSRLDVVDAAGAPVVAAE